MESQTSRGPSRVQYEIDPRSTILISIDFQTGFGDNAWEPVPHAAAAMQNFNRAARAWRSAGGKVMHVQTFFTAEHKPNGRIIDFAPDIGEALAQGAPAAEAYSGLIEPGDTLIHKTNFSAVVSSDLISRLKAAQCDTVVIGGLTTPICVQTTVDALSMAGIKVVVLADACASQAIGALSAQAAHDAAISRMAYVFASIESTDSFIQRAGAGNIAA